MNDFMSWFIMVGIVALVIFICILILKSDKDKEKPDLKEEDDEPNEPKETCPPTEYPEEWYVAQLDPENGNPIKEMDLEIPSSGIFIIGRSGDCDFVLQNVSEKEGASRWHLGIGKDDKGYFAKSLIRDNGSLALTYIDDNIIMDSFSLVDKQIVWLGNIPIVFVRKIKRKKDLKFNPVSVKRNEEEFKRDYNETIVLTRSMPRSSNKQFRR